MDYRIEELIPTMDYSPEYTDALFLLCERFYTVGRYKDAETLAFELRKITPCDVRVYKLSAAIQAAQNNYLFAFNCYWTGSQIHESDPELWLGMAQASIHLDKIADAVDCLDKVLEIAKDDAELYDHARKLRNLIQ